MAKKETGAENVRWDLGCFYRSIDDPQIEQDVKWYITRAELFESDYRGKLGEALGRAIQARAELSMLGSKIGYFLFLSFCTDLNDEKVKSKMNGIEDRMQHAAGKHLAWVANEMCDLDQAVIDAAIESDPVVAHHRSWIEDIRKDKPHLLSTEVESALAMRSPFSSSSWSEFFDEVEADLRFPLDDEEHTMEEILDIMSYDPDSDRRARALKVIHDVFGGHFIKYSAQTLGLVVRENALENKERNYPHPMASRNIDNKVSDGIVEALHQAVKEAAGPLAVRHYRLKARLLGKERLLWSDRNAKPPFADTSVIPYQEAERMVLKAYRSFSPTLAELVQSMIDLRRIDAPVVKGKRSGAFCCYTMVPGQVPISYVLLNYLGTTRDVMTMAHELGHAVHGLLGYETQGILMGSAPTAYAETASIFGEMTTFNALKARLLEQGDERSLLALLMDKADGAINSVVRQIGFSNFERQVHGRVHEGGGWPTIEELNGLWMGTVKELYGEDGDVFDYRDTERLWCYIPHFHDPFYVYAYACGELLTQSLYALQGELKERFEPLYLEMLKSGGTKSLKGLLAPFGQDPEDPQFWANGIRISLGKMVDEAESLAKRLDLIP
ncbi:hypothetical protein AMJ57_04285 [Parcubacteria bacterium SG8_24]|nr:MAG: hypothetical protein AMJ57_04285 [Parcubacteria bacterium SG8_24]